MIQTASRADPPSPTSCRQWVLGELLRVTPPPPPKFYFTFDFKNQFFFFFEPLSDRATPLAWVGRARVKEHRCCRPQGESNEMGVRFLVLLR